MKTLKLKFWILVKHFAKRHNLIQLEACASLNCFALSDYENCWKYVVD